MPHTGTITPPQASPPLASSFGGPRGASSPPPPPPPAANNPASQPPRASSTTPPLSREQDPFLAQTAAIPLSERDRQEGYDVELLNARPRGRYSSDLGAGADDDSLGGGREKYGAGLAAVHSHPGGGAAAAAAAPVPALGALGGAGLGPVGSGAGAGALAAGPGVSYGAMHPGGAAAGPPAVKEYGADSSGGHSGATAHSGKRRRPWYLRPLTLLILALFIIAVALAVGLGVGLSERDSRSKSDDLSASSSNSTLRSRLSTTRTRSGTASTGLVVPSSDTSYWSSLATVTDDPSSSRAEGETGSGISTDVPSSITSIPSPVTATTLATTGNLPIPANSSTVISGLTISVLSTTDESTAARATAAARMRRTMLFTA